MSCYRLLALLLSAERVEIKTRPCHCGIASTSGIILSVVITRMVSFVEPKFCCANVSVRVRKFEGCWFLHCSVLRLAVLSVMIA
jgi:hypothetical protein